MRVRWTLAAKRWRGVFCAASLVVYVALMAGHRRA